MLHAILSVVTVVTVGIVTAALATASLAQVASGTYPPIEASFKLAVEGNPFDYSENDVIVTLALPDGEEMKLPAFFDGDDMWRVRHSPTAKGVHTVRQVTRNGEAVEVEDLALEGMADDAEEPGRGFIRLDDSKMNFVFDDGSPYYPVGYNLAWRHMGEPPMPKLTVSIGRMGEAGVNWTRLWMNHWDSKNLDWIEQRDQYAQPPLGELNLEVARKWDDILRASEESGVYLQMVLQHHGQYSSTTNPNWDVNPWNKANGGFLKTPADFFTSVQAKALTKQKYRYIIARYGYSPVVMAWELFNEVQYTDGYRSDLPAVAAWHEEMANFLREHDSYAHLITTSSVVTEESLWREMDYYQGHVYPPDILAAIQTLDALNLDRAYFYGEIGASAGGDNPENAAKTVQQTLWGALMSNASGAAQYWYWYTVEPNGLLSQYKAAAEFIEQSNLLAQQDLTPIEVTADTGTLGPLRFGPGIDWEPSKTTQYTVRRSGTVDGLGGMSAYLQGESNREMFPYAEFKVDFPESGTFALQIDQMTRSGARLEIALDGQAVSMLTLNAPPTFRRPGGDDSQPSNIVRLDATLEIAIPTGEHTIRLENTGADWAHIGGIALTPYASELAVLGKGNDQYAILWAYRRDEGENPVTGTVQVPGLADGSYRITWWDTYAGAIVETETATVTGGQPLSLKTPAIEKDLAAWITRDAGGD